MLALLRLPVQRLRRRPMAFVVGLRLIRPFGCTERGWQARIANEVHRLLRTSSHSPGDPAPKATRHHRQLPTHTISDLVDALYQGLDPRLKPAAAFSVLAHLEALEDAGRVTLEGEAGLTGVWAATLT